MLSETLQLVKKYGKWSLSDNCGSDKEVVIPAKVYDLPELFSSPAIVGGVLG